MKVTKTPFEGLVVIEPAVFEDSRGYFMESFNAALFAREGIDFKPVQDNESSSLKGVVRGLHYQLAPEAQAKLIRVVSGRIFDVALDLRKNSPTFGKWYGIELDSDSKKQFFIPKGFAHGFSVLSDKAVIQYKCDNFYNRSLERGIAWNDPFLEIDWKFSLSQAIISEKDRNNPLFSKAEFNF